MAEKYSKGDFRLCIRPSSARLFFNADSQSVSVGNPLHLTFKGRARLLALFWFYEPSQYNIRKEKQDRNLIG